MNRIEDITVKAVVDESPDTSWLGEYTDSPDDWAICRHCGEYLALVDDEHEIPRVGRKYRFFRPYSAGEKEGTTEYQEYGYRDYKRMEGLGRGDWCFIGIMAEATVSTESGRTETLTSGGLWGIESDAGKDYLDSVTDEELADLRSHLESFGVDLTDWDELTEDIEIEFP